MLSLSACVASTCVVVSPQKTGEAVPLLAPISTFNHTDGKKEKKRNERRKKTRNKKRGDLRDEQFSQQVDRRHTATKVVVCRVTLKVFYIIKTASYIWKVEEETQSRVLNVQIAHRPTERKRNGKKRKSSSYCVIAA